MDENNNKVNAEVTEDQQNANPAPQATQPPVPATVEQPKPKMGRFAKIAAATGIVLACFGLGAAAGKASEKRKQASETDEVVDADNSVETTE